MSSSHDDGKDPSSNRNQHLNGESQPLNRVGAALRPALDFERLRLPTNFGGEVGVKKLVAAVVARKPGRQEFLRVHEEWQFSTALLEMKGERRDVYLVDRPLWERYSSDLIPVIIYVATTRQGGTFLWYVRTASGGRPLDTWNESAHFAAQRAKTEWVRVSANMNAGHYDVFEALGELGEPEWPTCTFEELLDKAFKDRFIADNEHPVLRRLRGEMP